MSSCQKWKPYIQILQSSKKIGGCFENHPVGHANVCDDLKRDHARWRGIIYKDASALSPEQQRGQNAGGMQWCFDPFSLHYAPSFAVMSHGRHTFFRPRQNCRWSLRLKKRLDIQLLKANARLVRTSAALVKRARRRRGWTFIEATLHTENGCFLNEGLLSKLQVA